MNAESAMNDKDETKITAAQDEILTVDEAAALLKLHKTTVHKLALAGKIPARRIGRQWRFSRVKITPDEALAAMVTEYLLTMEDHTRSRRKSMRKPVDKRYVELLRQYQAARKAALLDHTQKPLIAFWQSEMEKYAQEKQHA